MTISTFDFAPGGSLWTVVGGGGGVLLPPIENTDGLVAGDWVGEELWLDEGEDDGDVAVRLPQSAPSSTGRRTTTNP